MDNFADDQLAQTMAQANRNLSEMERGMARLSRSIGTDLTQALQQAVFSSRSLSDVFNKLALGVSKDIFKASVKPLQGAATSMVSDLIGGLFGSSVTAFAKGGVVQGATMFGAGSGHSGDGLGLMGEAGPEAIMPLSRDENGRLGVRTSGASNRGAAPVVNVTIQTSSPESFKASTGQISATLARAVAQGNRRL